MTPEVLASLRTLRRPAPIAVLVVTLALALAALAAPPGWRPGLVGAALLGGGGMAWQLAEGRRKRAAREGEWEAALNALPEGIAVLDSGGRVRRANGALARLVNLPDAGLLERPFWDMVIGAVEGEDAVVGAARRGERPQAVTLRSAALNRTLRLTAAPLAGTAARAAVVILVEDVTDQRTLDTQLIQSEKLAAVGQLVSGVAHELNNPLTSIAGLAEFLQERPSIPAAEREHLRVIHEQAERAGRIVRNLLTFARKTTPGTAVVDLHDLMKRTVLLVDYESRLRGVTLVPSLAAGALEVRGNQGELQQVLLNLITNAVQAVQTLPPGAPRRVALLSEREGNHAVVRVRDSGPGVPPDQVPLLFTPFFTTKEPGEGTGLGLWISYGIIGSHGGRLAYRAAPGGGAEFWFTLPSAPASGPAAILIVDDDPATERVAAALFGPRGLAVERVATGAEGLRRSEERGWALVLVDGELSADGRRPLAETLLEREGGPALAVLVRSPAAAERWRRLGATILPKPLVPRDLLVAAGPLLSER